MENFMDNVVVQVVLALCTLAGGIVAFIKLANYASGQTTDNTQPQHNSTEDDKTKEQIPSWIYDETNIIKKAFFLWQYKILMVLYSGKVRKSSFIKLIKLFIPAGLLFAGIAVIFPYWFICITIWIAIMAPIFVPLLNLPGPEGMLTLVAAYIPGIPIAFAIYYFPPWLVITMYPLVIIIGLWLLWFELAYKKSSTHN